MSLSIFSALSAPTPRTRSTPVIKYIINLLFMINLPTVVTITSTGYSSKLLNETKINTNEIKHSGENNACILE